jgi:guanylate kinase
MRKGEIFIVAAPSGTGKDTLIEGLIAGKWADLEDIVHSVSHTTRKPRAGEVDGTDYHFVDRSAFQKMISEDQFLEWAEYNRHRYGTSKQEVLPRLDRGIDVVLDIEVQGAEQILRRLDNAHGILILPPSYEVLEERLRKRGSDEADQIAARLAVSLWEIERYELFDYVIINDDLRLASQALAAIILEKRHRREPQEERVQAILSGFRRTRKRS